MSALATNDTLLAETERQPLFVPEGKILSPKRSVAIDQELVYGFCEWSALEWKIFSLVVSQLNAMELSPKEMADEKLAYRAVTFPVYALAKKLGISKSNAVRDITNAVMKLRQKAIFKIIKDEYGNYAVETKGCIKVEVGDEKEFLVVHYIEGRKTKVAKFVFNGQLKPYISMMNGSFLKENVNIIVDFKSVYALRMYMILSHVLRRTGNISQTLTRTYKLHALRLFLGVQDNEYPRFYDFRKRVLDPAIKEISDKNLMDISFSVAYSGGRSSEAENITFRYSLLLPDSGIATLPESRTPDKKVAASIALGKEFATLEADKNLIERWCRKGYKKSGIFKLVKLYGYKEVKSAFDSVETCLSEKDSGFLIVKAFCEAKREGGAEA